jgi:hypothetical protein
VTFKELKKKVVLERKSKEKRGVIHIIMNSSKSWIFLVFIMAQTSDMANPNMDHLTSSAAILQGSGSGIIKCC